MLEYERIYVSKGIDVNETDGLRECIIYHYWKFLEINFRFQSGASKGSKNIINILLVAMMMIIKVNCFA